MKSKLGLAACLLGLLTLFLFQNCAPQSEMITTDSRNLSSAGPIGPLKVAKYVEPHEDTSTWGVDPALSKDATLTPRGPLEVTHSVQPLTLDFALDSDSSTYTYRLSVLTGQVYLFANHALVYSLSGAEFAQLTGYFDQTLLDFVSNEQATDCAVQAGRPYASIKTNYGVFDLGGGVNSCVSLDIYRADSHGQTVGVADFLSRLQSRIASQGPATTPNAMLKTVLKRDNVR